jgi:hypothetical protein
MMKYCIPKMGSTKIKEDNIISFKTSSLSPPIVVVPNNTTYGCFDLINPKFLKVLALANF